MIVPTFDRWRARLIAHTDGDSLGPAEEIRFSQVAPTVALMCPFQRYDGEPCQQLITYYLRTSTHALGACHRHLAHALDILVAAGRTPLADPSDEDLLEPAGGSPKRAPSSEEDAQLAAELIGAEACSAADFGTTSIHEGYGLVVGANIVLSREGAERHADCIDIADDFGIDVQPQPDGSVRLTTPRPELAEEWICQNRALREMLRDALEGKLDRTGYRYRALADALPEQAAFESRLFTAGPTGPVVAELQLLATTLERPRQQFARLADRRRATLHVDRLPRPGDYVELDFARYRVVAVETAAPDAPARVTAVLDRIHRPSRN
jgi:hypothetical protein